MSLRLRLLNLGLRLFEKPFLARVATPQEVRAGFLRKARWYFHPPRGTSYSKVTLAAAREIEAIGVRCGAVREDAVLLYFHGGGYVFGAPETHKAMLARLSREAGMAAVLPRYRLAPEHPFPAAPEDARAAWDGLVATGVAPERIVLGGDSAGGGLALSLLAALLQEGVRPAGCFAFSPLTDLTVSGGSMTENVQSDVILPASRAQEMAGFFLAGADPADPRASPLFADFTGAPPVWLTVGNTEILRDDTLRLADRLLAQKVAVTLEVQKNHPHVWLIFQTFLPEARATLADLGTWIRRVLEPADGN